MTTIRPATDTDLAALGSMLEQRDGSRYDDVSVRRHCLGLDPARIVVLVAEVDGRVVATSSLLLRELTRGARRTRAAYWTDLYVDEAFRRHMLYVPLARATLDAAHAAEAELVYTANRRPDVYRAHLKLGFRIAGVAATRARPVRPLGLVARVAAGPRVARLTTPFDSLLVAGLGKLEKRALRHDPTLRITVGPANDARLASFAPGLERARGRSLGQAMDARSLVDRYATPLDGRGYQLLLAEQNGAVRGGAVVRTARRGAFEATVVLDLVDGGDRAVAHALVAAIERWAAEQDSDLVLVLDACPDLEGLWDEVGYRVTPETYVLLVAPAERVADPVFGNAATWRFAFADHDAF